MKVPAPSLAPILRSDAQGRILARVLADPESSYNLSELVAERQLVNAATRDGVEGLGVIVGRRPSRRGTPPG